MKLAYVAGPYRSPDGIIGVHRNIQSAERVALDLWRRGYAVICPHKNTAYFDGACPDDVWLEGDLVMLRRCDLIVLATGWEISKGALRELREAGALGIPAMIWRGECDPLEDVK